MQRAAAFDAADALGADSSPDPEISSDVTADSSPAEDGNSPSLFDVVRDAVAPESSAGEGSEVEEDDDQDADAEDAEDGDTAEAEKDVEPESEEKAVERLISELKEEGRSLQKVERFREVLTENKQLKGEVGELRTMREQLDQITQAAQRSGLQDQTVADLWATPIMFMQDPVAAVRKLREITDQLALMAGDKLPEELQAKVNDGYLSEEDAKAIATARAEAQRERTLREQTEAEQARNAQAARQAEGTRALTAFEQSLIQSDPDYTTAARKWHRDRFTQAYLAAGRPTDAKEIVSIAEKTWKEVKSDLSEFAPKQRTPRPPIPGRRASNAPPAQPATMFEAIAQAVGGATSED